MTTHSFAEDHLPEGQPLIETRNVKRCRSLMRMITDPRRRTPTMGVISGVAGVGKTIAAQYYLDSLPPHAQTALQTAIKVKVMPRSTPKALAQTILDSLLEKPEGRNIYEIADKAAVAIERNYIKLLVVDEADRLNEDSFDVLRHLFDKTGCRIVLVGLPNILSVIDKYEKFSSRVGLRMPFVPLTIKEVLDTLLPGIALPCWTYDPENHASRQLGEKIWHKVNPSLRNLQSLLETASQMARDEELPAITADLIDEAYLWMMTQQEHQNANQAQRDAEREPKGKHERTSEERHEGKKKKRKKVKDGDARASEEQHQEEEQKETDDA
jgi:DNA transposition AAA+ family ATPase